MYHPEMSTLQDASALRTLSSSPQKRVFVSALRYLLSKALTIMGTIFIGVFITMLVVNYPAAVPGRSAESPFAKKLEDQIELIVQINISDTIIQQGDSSLNPRAITALSQNLRTKAGLDLPTFPRYLFWTVKALSLNWGEFGESYISQFLLGGGARAPSSGNLVLETFPNTLLLVGTAYLLVFLIGMPLSLQLARRYGTWLDRWMAVLSPISSVPSWVFAILLITIFAVQLGWFPVGGMFDFNIPTDPVQYVLTLARHMALPVAALVMSLLFQLVFTWRTFFVIYSEEDYVELARAKGLKNNVLEKQYILKPALPYIITSFATSLIGFWQLTVVLEKTFQWPGLGLLYLESLPNYWGERIQIGDLMIVIQIVVIFAYLLGMLVFILDIVYVIIDPRIHLMPASNVTQTNARLTGARSARQRVEKKPVLMKPVKGRVKKRRFSFSRFARGLGESVRVIRARSRLFLRELRAYPSAIFGLGVIFSMLAGSIYAVVALPYEEYGRDFEVKSVTGRNLIPRMAVPLWFNSLSWSPRLSTIIMDESSKDAKVSTRVLDNGWVEKTITYQFDYNYRETPSDVFLYLDSKYADKIPFVSMKWTAPDGSVIELKSKAVDGNLNYDFRYGLPIAELLRNDPAWKQWFVTEGQYPTPAYQLLFAQPGVDKPTPQKGRYQLETTALLFDEQSDVHPQLILLGQVYGFAGTDYLRRDLTVPLFWGMPFALIIGFLGTLVTTLIAMLLPAIGVWFGGWLDAFIQRLTDVNMVLPSLAIVVLANLLFGVSIWILLGIIILLNAFGAPIKTFRSAFLQAKEAPYIEVARAYGASNTRIILQYLVPRILPVFIPQLIVQIPSFIFLEATLGFFNIKSVYPTWGRIIYDGLARGALYGSPFWVLEPIFLLLLTGLAFAMLGSALERILNPRIIADVPPAQESNA